MNDEGILPAEDIRMWIYTIRGKQVMLDRDLAVLYGVETKVLNQAVKRNIERFPEDFRFQLDDEEKNELVTNCDRLKRLKHSSTNPYEGTCGGMNSNHDGNTERKKRDTIGKILTAPSAALRDYILHSHAESAENRKNTGERKKAEKLSIPISSMRGTCGGAN